ncbi:MAG: hypothetical protein M1816_006294 [Peltula sp. TS41687]|nr:MAG: hypothetical protein M1816_006294 [Peltula sp. TS41687]
MTKKVTVEGARRLLESTDLTFEIGNAKTKKSTVDSGKIKANVKLFKPSSFTAINSGYASSEADFIDPVEDDVSELYSGDEQSVFRQLGPVDKPDRFTDREGRLATEQPASAKSRKVSKPSKGKAADSTEDESTKEKPSAAKSRKAARPSGGTEPVTPRARFVTREVPLASTEIEKLAETAASKMKRTYSATNLGEERTFSTTTVGDGTYSNPGLSSAGKPNGKAEFDPENHEIKRLREEELLYWPEIAEVMNTTRVRAGRIPSFSESGVYARYMRNAPRIAFAAGKAWKPRQVGNRTIGANYRAQDPLPPFTSQEDALLVHTYQAVVDETWTRVADKMQAANKDGKRFEPEQLAKRYRLL